MEEPGANDAQAAYWEARAPAWIEAEDSSLTLVSGPVGDAAIDRLALRPGERVLDVGCGTGPTSLRIAQLVAPGGTVTGADISETMVATATARAEAAGLDTATFVVADAQTADLGAGAFDAVFSRFGVMFFSDPVAAFANLHGALRGGGRLVFACWQELVRNEWMTVPGAAAIAVSGLAPNMPEPGAPGPFSLCDPARVRQVLGDAGFGDVELQDLTYDVVIHEDRIEQVLHGLQRMGAVREQLESFAGDADMRERILAAVRDELAGRVDAAGDIHLAGATWVVSARA
ncbi:MAG: methyltransferase domain-containing protein [Actinobacteria bacterium]|nr:methyltransferase domain-containing protein [Actinomycetota bacterium]